MSRISFLRRIVLAPVCVFVVSAAATISALDPRQYMHGIGVVSGAAANTSNVFFSSPGLPPCGADRGSSWPHDVYVVQWYADTGVFDASCILIQRPKT